MPPYDAKTANPVTKLTEVMFLVNHNFIPVFRILYKFVTSYINCTSNSILLEGKN